MLTLRCHYAHVNLIFHAVMGPIKQRIAKYFIPNYRTFSPRPSPTLNWKHNSLKTNNFEKAGLIP